MIYVMRLLNILKRRGFDTSEYSGFSINEINTMYANKQLDLLLYKSDDTNSKIYIKYYLSLSWWCLWALPEHPLSSKKQIRFYKLRAFLRRRLLSQLRQKMRVKIVSNGKEDISVEKKLKIERHKEAVNL